ncbi:MAG: hypothetical protein NVSMB32_17740 [Actinomycetota bacterium]
MEVVPFTQDLVESLLRSEKLRFLRDQDGNFMLEFQRSDETGCDLRYWIIADGTNKTILSMSCMTDVEFPRSEWGRMFLLCNTWNADRRWPKAFLSLQDFKTSESARLVCEFQVDLQAGCFAELLKDTIDTMLSSSYQFWTWLHMEQGI